MARALFLCTSRTDYAGGSTRYEFSAAKRGDDHDESDIFWTATPSGQLTISVQSGGPVFRPGAFYHLDFTFAPTPVEREAGVVA